MSAGNKAVKVTAKSILLKNMLRSAFASLIVIFSYLICLIISQLSTIVFTDVAYYALFIFSFIFINLPLFLGLIRFFWRMQFDAIDIPITVFVYFTSFNRYVKTVKFILSLLAKIILFALILYFPLFIIWLLTNSFIYDLLNISIPIWISNLNGIRFFVFVFSSVLLFLISIKYYMAPILFIADENIDIKTAIKSSSIITRRTFVDFSYLLLSLIGWIILSLFHIFNFFILPYIILVYVVHSRFSIVEYNYFQTKMNENNNFNLLESEINEL